MSDPPLTPSPKVKVSAVTKDNLNHPFFQQTGGNNKSNPSSPFSQSLSNNASLVDNIRQQSSKKKQSTLKSLVQGFGEVLAVYRNDARQLKALVEGLASLYLNMLAINRTLNGPKSYIWKIGVLSKFPDLYSKLAGRMVIDIEALMVQIRSFR